MDRDTPKPMWLGVGPVREVGKSISEEKEDFCWARLEGFLEEGLLELGVESCVGIFKAGARWYSGQWWLLSLL